MNVGLTGRCARSIPRCLAVAGALMALGASPALAATFSAGGKAKTDRSAPYRVSLTLPAATRAGAIDKVTASAYLKLRNGTHATKTLKLGMRACG